MRIEPLELRIAPANLAVAISVGAAGNQNVSDAAVDSAGSTYVVGTFTGAVDFDPGPGSVFRTAPAGKTEGFIAKYTSIGALAWVNVVRSGDGFVSRPELAVSSSGDVFFTGEFGLGGAPLDFVLGDSPSPSLQLTPNSSSGSVYVAKINASGAFAWAQQFGGSGASLSSSDIATGPNGSIFLSGNITNGPLAGGLTIGTDSIQSDAGEVDLFVVKLIDDLTPSVVWARDTISTGLANLGEPKLAVDGAGQLSFAGTFGGTFSVPGQGLSASASDAEDVVIAQLDFDGNWLQLLSISGGGEGIDGPGDDVAILASESGQLVVAGHFSDTADFDPGVGVSPVSPTGGSDLFVLFLNSAGNFQQVATLGGNLDEKFLGITRHANGFALAGTFQGSLTVGLGDGPATITSTGPDDAFLLTMNGGGGSTALQKLAADSSPAGKGLLVDELLGGGVVLAGSTTTGITIAGNFRGTFDADPGAPVKNVASKGGVDFFISSLFPNQLSEQVVFQPVLNQAFSFGSSGFETGSDVEVDSLGNIYLSGFFRGTVDFDPGKSTVNLTASSPTGNPFVAKFSPEGNLIWARQLETTLPAQDASLYVELDGSGNVYLAGTYEASIAVDNLTQDNADPAGGKTDIFLATLDATSGAFFRLLSFGGSSGNELIESFAVDASSDTLAIAGFVGSPVDFDLSEGIVEITPAAGSNAFVVALDTTGFLKWARHITGGGTGGVAALDILSSGDVIGVGRVTNSIDLNFGGTPVTITSSPGGDDAFVVKFDAFSGFPVSPQVFGGTGIDQGNAVFISASDEIYIGGSFMGTMTIDARPSLVETSGTQGDAFVMKLSASLSVLGAIGFGGVGTDQVFGLDMDGLGNLVVAGQYFSNVDFDPSAGIARLTGDAHNLFIARFKDSDLSFHSAFRIDAFDSREESLSGLDIAQAGGFAVDPAGNVFFVGGFFKSFDADVSSGSRVLTSKGASDLVFAEYAPSGLADARQSRTFHDAAGNLITLQLTGPGTLVYTLAGGVGDFANLDTVELSGTTLASALTIQITSGPGLLETVVSRILTTDPQQHLGSLFLGDGVVLGDAVADTTPDLLITGASKNLRLSDIAANAIIKLGQDLPYDVPGNITTPDTYNHKPNLTTGNVGNGVVIEVTGDGTPGGVGGGGLGKVVFEQWENPGFIRTTQSVGSITVLKADFMGVLEIDANNVGAGTTANLGSMTVQDGAWGSSGSEIEGAIGSFSAEAFLAGASITAGSIGNVTITSGNFEGTLTLTDPVSSGTNVFTVGTDFTGIVNSTAPLKSIKVKGTFMGSLSAPTIGAISAFSFVGTTTGNAVGDPLRHNITATNGPLGLIKSTAGTIFDYEMSAAGGMGGFLVKLGKLTADTVGIDRLSLQAASIGKVTVNLSAAKTAPGIDLTGIRDSSFVTTGTAAKGVLRGSIGAVNVTLLGVAAGGDALGIGGSTFDARVDANEFGVNPASTANLLANLKVTIKGQGGASVGLDGSTFLADNIGAVTVLSSKGANAAATSRAVNEAQFESRYTVAALLFDGDATFSQVRELGVFAGGSIAKLTVKAKTASLGSLENSQVLAGQALNVGAPTEKEVKAALAKAVLGPVKLSGSLAESTLAAGASIGAVNVGGAMVASQVLAGALLGDPFADNDESWQAAAAIASVTVLGSFQTSTLAAGVNPVNGLFGDADDVAAAAAGPLVQTGRIGAINLAGLAVAPAEAALANHQSAIQAAAIKSLKTAAGSFTDFTLARFLDSGAGGEDSADVLVRLVV